MRDWQRVCSAVAMAFGERSLKPRVRSADEPDDTVEVAHLSIRRVTEGYLVERAAGVSNYPSEPDDVEVVDLTDKPVPLFVALKLVLDLYAESLVESAMEWAFLDQTEEV